MKKIKRKEHLKKLIFIEHIIVLALFSITTIFVITKTSARDEELSRNESNYINDSFRNQEPTTGDIFDALYS
jgi:selenocysteine-specific translation elongation factor